MNDVPSSLDGEAVAPAQPIESVAFPLDLSEWCAAQSQGQHHPELLGAFFSVETAGGRTKALASEFAARLDAFANAPA